MTKQEQIAEYIKCKNDFFYYVDKYVLIELPGGDVPFNLYQKQKEMIEQLLDKKFMAILKTRQTGISTTIQAFCSWLLIFHDNVVVAILSKDAGEATSFSRFTRAMVEKAPTWLRPKFTKYTEQTFVLSNGAKMISSTVNPQEPTKTLRGKAITFLVVDEAAFIQKLDTAMTSIIPALSTSQKNARNMGIPYGTVIISTPNKTLGTGAYYFNIWQKAQMGTSIYTPFMVYWKDIPELANDPDWVENIRRMFDYDEKKIAQELEMTFIPTTGSFFDERTCAELQRITMTSTPSRTWKLFNGDIWEFQKPIPGRHYIIGIDTAGEFGEDYSAITIFDYVTLEQVWEYHGKLQVTDFCKVVEYACAQYPGVVVPENNSLGNQISEFIDRTPYMTMLYRHQKSSNIIVRGVTTDTKTRPLMIDAMYTYVSQYPGMVKSKRLALELIGLVSKSNGKVEADTGAHDDLAMSLAFCMYVRKYDPPMAIDIKEGSYNDQSFSKVVGMNYGSHSTDIKDILEGGEERDLDSANARILKIAKEEATSFEHSYFDTLGLYRG